MEYHIKYLKGSRRKEGGFETAFLVWSMASTSEEEQDFNIRIILSKCQARQKQLGRKHPALAKTINMNALDGCMGGNFYLTDHDWEEMATFLDQNWLTAVYALNEYAKEHFRFFLDLDLYYVEPVGADYLNQFYRQIHHLVNQTFREITEHPVLACCHVLQPNSLRKIPCPSHLLDVMRSRNPSLNDVADSKISVYKFGAHLVWPNLIVNQQQAEQVRDLLVNCLMYEPLEFGRSNIINSWDTVLDRDVYQKGNLRLPGARKTEKRFFQYNTQRGCFRSWVKSSYRYHHTLLGLDSLPLFIKPHPPYRDLLINVYKSPEKLSDDIAFIWLPDCGQGADIPSSLGNFVQDAVRLFHSEEWQQPPRPDAQQVTMLHDSRWGLEHGSWEPSPLNMEGKQGKMHIMLEEPGRQGKRGKGGGHRKGGAGGAGGGTGSQRMVAGRGGRGGTASGGLNETVGCEGVLRAGNNAMELTEMTKEYPIVTQLLRRLPLEQHRSLSIRKLLRGNTRRYYKVDVQGIHERFCTNKGEPHTHSKIYFYITIAGISQKCYSTKPLNRLHGLCSEFRGLSHPLTLHEKEILFPDQADTGHAYGNARSEKRGEKRKAQEEADKSMTAGSIYNSESAASKAMRTDSPVSSFVNPVRVQQLPTSSQAYLKELCDVASKLGTRTLSSLH